MIKPIPSQELIAKVMTSPEYGGLIHISVYSEDARAWLETEAPQFGNFYPPTFERHHTLFVSGGYKTKDVADYLNTYNQSEKSEKAE